MAMAPLRQLCPDLADTETRSVAVTNATRVPDGRYVFLESYCDESGCDCRRVFISVASVERREILATIGYGWEGADFYRRWMYGRADAEEIRALRGPALEPLQPQSQEAAGLLELFRDVLARDPAYGERLARHYRRFKKAVARSAAAAGGPNVPCPCGSGKRFEHCCGRDGG